MLVKVSAWVIGAGRLRWFGLSWCLHHFDWSLGQWWTCCWPVGVAGPWECRQRLGALGLRELWTGLEWMGGWFWVEALGRPSSGCMRWLVHRGGIVRVVLMFEPHGGC
jgi:hypothetical protein